MIKIRISYEDIKELEKVLKLLRPVIKGYKISKSYDNRNGRYKRIYIDVKEL